jgi:predicted O-methyltransferase YrrM
MKYLHGNSLFSFIQNVDFQYFPGAIYPSELACFLNRCKKANIDCIIESGRADGYSTAVLAAYGEQTNIDVISIDFEADKPRALACRKRLKGYGKLRLLDGDAFRLFPDLLSSISADRQAIALLIDGPKMHEAVYLSAAAVAVSPVRVVAHHNTEPGTPWYDHFVQRFPNVERLEDSDLIHSKEFNEFREWERRFTGEYHSLGRNLAATSLVVSSLPTVGPDKRYLAGPSFRHTFCAVALYSWWHLGTPAWVPIRFFIKIKNRVKDKMRIR